MREMEREECRHGGREGREGVGRRRMSGREEDRERRGDGGREEGGGITLSNSRSRSVPFSICLYWSSSLAIISFSARTCPCSTYT